MRYKNVCFEKCLKKSIAALHRLTQDGQYSTRHPKTHVGGPDLDFFDDLYHEHQNHQLICL